MIDVFISYPRAQRERVEPIKDRLQALDLDVFFDIEGIDGGAEFPEVIDRALKSSKAVLACWSPLYFTRRWCMIECRFAAGEDPSILVPVVLEPIGRRDLPADFQGTNRFDLTRWSGQDEHEDWNRTLISLGKLVGRELAPPLKKGLFGGVRVGAAPEAPATAAQRADLIEDLRRTWEQFPDRDDEAMVARFLARVRETAAGSGLEFEVEHHVSQLRRRAEQKAALAAQRARPGAVWRDVIDRLGDDALPEMVTLSPGRFLMGSPKGEERWKDYDGREEPQHPVDIAYSFAMGRYPVTFAQWDAARAAGAKLENPGDQGWGRGARPVINVSWEDAQAYLAWLNTALGLLGEKGAYRLPSEAEWEYACRAGTTTPFSFGETISTDQANYDGNTVYGRGKKGAWRKHTMPVGSFAANGFGLHDMHGNVWEWCADPWHETYQGAPTDGSVWGGGDASRRVLRGGSWILIPEYLRSAYRYWFYPSYRNYNIGFRLARTL